MKSLLGVILIGLAFFGYAEVCSAECGWILWYRESFALASGLPSSRSEDIKWEIISGSPNFQHCLEAKKEEFKRLSENIKGLGKTIKETDKDSENIIVGLEEKPDDEIILAIYLKKAPSKSINRIFKLICLPDTVDPKKLERR